MTLTVGELREKLDEYGDAVPVVVVLNYGDEVEENTLAIESVGYGRFVDTEDGIVAGVAIVV